MSNILIKEGLKYLKEVFNRPYPVKRDSLSYADIYTARTEDGREIYINIELRDADDVMLKTFDGFSPMIAKEFGWNPNHVIGKIDFSVDDSTSITGEGDAPRILATVVEAIRLSMSTNRNLVGFMFWGFGISRSRLYRTMVRRLGRQYNMDVVKSKNVPKVDGEFLLLADANRARYMFTKEVFEDIGPKTSKQSIRPYVKNAVRGLREALAGAGPFDSRNIPNLVPNPYSYKDPRTPNYSPSMLNRRVIDFDDEYIGPSKDKSIVPYSMTDTAPITYGDAGLGRETMNKINSKMYGIGKRSGLPGAGNKTGRTIGKSKRAVRRLNEREQMHTGGSPHAISKVGLDLGNLKSKPDQAVFDRVNKPAVDLMNKYPGIPANEVPQKELHRSIEDVRQRMYDEIQGQQGIFGDDFEIRRSYIDKEMLPVTDPTVSQGILSDKLYAVRPKYAREFDSLRKTLGGRSYTGLTSRTKRGPR